MKHLLFLLALLSSCTPQTEPNIDLTDWREETYNTNKVHRDTYNIIVYYLNGDSIILENILYSHWPTDKDIQPEYLSGSPSFIAPDNEEGKMFMPVKNIRVTKATVGQGNIEYIQQRMREQDSGKGEKK